MVGNLRKVMVGNLIIQTQGWAGAGGIRSAENRGRGQEQHEVVSVHSGEIEKMLVGTKCRQRDKRDILVCIPEVCPK